MISPDGNKLKPICVLDACAIINLIYIDLEHGNDFLIRKLEDYYCLYICEKVLKETKKNAYSRSGKRVDDRKEIGRKIAYFRRFIKPDEIILKDCGKEFFDTVEGLANYKKKNGEFYSTALSLYLSRYSFSSVTFYTDDKPAEEHFTSFFRNQQIGKIEDSIDLLILLYWLNQDFREKELENLLTELYSQYAVSVKGLLSYIRKYKNSRKPWEIKGIKRFLDELEAKLDTLYFYGIKEIRRYIIKHSKQHPILCGKLEEYREVFELDSEKNKDILTKIRQARENVRKNRIYKNFE
jgi:hypothetical protein